MIICDRKLDSRRCIGCMPRWGCCKFSNGRHIQASGAGEITAAPPLQHMPQQQSEQQSRARQAFHCAVSSAHCFLGTCGKIAGARGNNHTRLRRSSCSWRCNSMVSCSSLHFLSSSATCTACIRQSTSKPLLWHLCMSFGRFRIINGVAMHCSASCCVELCCARC